MDKIVYLFGNKKEEKEPEVKEEIPVEMEEEAEQAEYELPDPATEDELEALNRLCSDKEAGILTATWDEIAAIMNDLFRSGGTKKPLTESAWRKMYTRMRKGEVEVPSNVVDFAPMRSYLQDMEKKRVHQRDERNAYARQIRSEARQDMILDIFRDTIATFPPIDMPAAKKPMKQQKSVYAMLSDIHYGLSFNSYVGVYNPAIAEARVLYYADNIILAGKKENADAVYVSLMGDMVSGVIHQSVRLENTENIIQQIVGVSELTATFLYYLSKHFKEVHVNSVDGNHSRLDPDLEKTLRKERMDSLIPWYCKAKLRDCPNVIFHDNDFDSSVGTFEIGEKIFACVHGDLEKDLKITATTLEKSMERHIDYLLAGHMHVPEMRAEDTMYIRNGSVCGSGDDYTMRKRLFSPPYQVFMVLSQYGEVESIHTVNLSEAGVKVELAEVG